MNVVIDLLKDLVMYLNLKIFSIDISFAFSFSSSFFLAPFMKGELKWKRRNGISFAQEEMGNTQLVLRTNRVTDAGNWKAIGKHKRDLQRKDNSQNDEDPVFVFLQRKSSHSIRREVQMGYARIQVRGKELRQEEILRSRVPFLR